MVKVCLNEKQIEKLIIESSIKNLYKSYANQISDAKNALHNYLLSNGVIMMNMENDRKYITLYIPSISNAIGKHYCICRVIDDNNEGYGSIYVKPLKNFKTIE